MTSSSRGGTLLVLNAGNTNVQSAFWDGSSFSGLSSCPTSEFRASSLPKGVPCAAASVVPSVERELREHGAFILSAACRTGLDLSRVDSSTLGADRLANAIALAATGPLPALCIDFGTAITFEIVDSSRAFRGGAIMPGRTLLRKALNEHTAKLPFVPLRDALPAMPGENTADSISLGADLGCVGAVRELLSSAALLFPGQTLRRLACGGDAPFFLRALDGIFENGGQSFTLLGVAKAWELNSL